jgi:hypothetical protein
MVFFAKRVGEFAGTGSRVVDRQNGPAERMIEAEGVEEGLIIKGGLYRYEHNCRP